MEHTNGTWKYENEISKRYDSRTGEPCESSTKWIKQVGERGLAIAIICEYGVESKANAALIASAPEMLEALKHYACPQCAGTDLEFPCLDTTACRAVKKAEGKI